jgi:hypothetical protein
MGMTMKYDFGSPGWMAFLHGLVVERVQRFRVEAPDIAWSICEVFTNPPAALSPDGTPLAWHCIVRDGVVTFGNSERQDVDYRFIADYDDILPLGRFDTRGEVARQQALQTMAAELRASERVQVFGDRSARDPRVGDFHDILARATA